MIHVITKYATDKQGSKIKVPDTRIGLCVVHCAILGIGLHSSMKGKENE
jgi:hypothetical protein